MKSLLLSLLLLTAAAGASAQTTTVNFPVTGGFYTLYPPTGQKFTAGPSSSNNSYIFSYATTGEACNISIGANTTYYARTATPTWTLALKTYPYSTVGYLTVSLYQPGYVPPLSEEEYTPVIPYRMPDECVE